jgi:hypothetical protein
MQVVLGCYGVDSIHLTQDRVKWPALVEYGNKHSSSIKYEEFLTSRVTVSFSRRTLLYKVSYNSQTPMEKGKRGFFLYFQLLLSLRNCR